MSDRLISYLREKYPRGNETLEKELHRLKCALDNVNTGPDEEMREIADDLETNCPKNQSQENDIFNESDDEILCEIAGELEKKKNHLDMHKEKCKKGVTPAKTSTTQKEVKSEISCKHCKLPFMDYTQLFEHVSANHPLANTIQSGGSVRASDENEAITTKEHRSNKTYNKKVHKYALNGNVQVIDIIPNDVEKYDILQFYANIKPEIKNELYEKRNKFRQIKWYLNTRAEMIRDLDDGTQNTITAYFRSKTYVSLQADDNEHNINEAIQKINGAMEEFIHKGSNWILNKVDKVEVSIVPYTPLYGSSYMELPNRIKATKAVINVKNTQDQKCFLWSVLAALHPVACHAENINHYRNYENELILGDIQYPVPVSKMEKIEKLNSDISINVFGFEDNELFPMYISKQMNEAREIDLLYLKSGSNSHYCYIKNFNRFLSMTKPNVNNKRYFCRRCLHGFISFDLLDKHKGLCKNFEFQTLRFPEEGKIDLLTFTDFHKQIRVPFTIYADFEALAIKYDTCLPCPEKSSNTHKTVFEPCGYAYKVVCANDKYSKPPVVYRGPNAAEHFIDNLIQEEIYIKNILANPEPLIMNRETESQFQRATSCYLCDKRFDTKTTKVRDHSHIGISGDINSEQYSNFRGSACNFCNLQLKTPSFIPVIFHNLMGFDEHPLVLALGKYKDKELSCIAKNMEKYISFSLGHLRFIDSYQFTSSSFENLISNLSQDSDKHFKHFRKSFKTREQLQLLLRKNVYCYDYIDSFDKFKETRLPSKDAFYNQLKGEPISDSDYKQAQDVWRMFQMKNLGDFHDLYVLTDTLLLADVFEKFRDMTLSYYSLDACHFMTAAGLAWSAAMKKSKITLELLSDPTMYNFFESSLRGGVSVISKKYACANNPYIPETFNPNKPTSYLMYYDATSLYSSIMGREKLPTGLFRWLSPDEVETFDVFKVPADGDVGYFLEVDLIYPESLHDAHNTYPLAPCHKTVNDADISPYNKKLWKTLFGNQPRVKTSKLIPTLENKVNYICHYRNLQLYISLGMKMTKIHRIVEFRQSAWLKDYINLNIDKRKLAKNDFEKDFFKLMCNSVFGRTTMNLRNRVQVKLVNDQTKLRKLVSKPSFERFQIFHENMVGVENKLTTLFMNQPIYAGASILELSKVNMYDFHYNVMQPMYGWENINVLFTDTDSLTYEIFTEDVYKDMETKKHLFDFKNYPQEHFLY